jgi:hypothetical protein
MHHISHKTLLECDSSSHRARTHRLLNEGKPVCSFKLRPLLLFRDDDDDSILPQILPHHETLFVFLIRIVGGGVQTGSTRHVGHWMAYCTCPGWLWWWRNWWNEDWQVKPKYSEKTCPRATLSTTNPTCPDPGSNPGRCGGKPATNRLGSGAAIKYL